MASQWYSLVSQKLFLASTLLDTATEEVTSPGSRTPAQKLHQEAAIQGSIELLLRAKRLLLVMIARLYQKRPDGTLSLTELTHLIGNEAVEIESLAALEQDNGSWWSHLNQLEVAQNSPPATRKSVSAENIIAVSTEAGPDRSVKALRNTLQAIKQFTDNLETQHGEW